MTPSSNHPAPLRDLLGTIDAGRVLDVASGTGQFTQLLADCLGGFDEIIGIDTSEKAIGRARASFSQSHVRFEVADATSLPYADSSFDTVAISNSLHHLEDPEAVFSEIRRVVTPGGRWIVSEMHSDAQSAGSQNAIDLHLWTAHWDAFMIRSSRARS